MRRNPALKMRQALEQAARDAAESPLAQSAPAPRSSSIAAIGGTITSSGEWVGFGRLGLDTLASFRLA
jgi:hypothetical protein